MWGLKSHLWGVLNVRFHSINPGPLYLFKFLKYHDDTRRQPTHETARRHYQTAEVWPHFQLETTKRLLYHFVRKEMNKRRTREVK